MTMYPPRRPAPDDLRRGGDRDIRAVTATSVVNGAPSASGRIAAHAIVTAAIARRRTSR